MIKSGLRKTVLTLQSIVPAFISQRLAGDFVPIFMLHRFSHPDRDISGSNLKKLRNCLEYFREKKYKAISLDELARTYVSGEKLPANSAVFTVDDGFLDQYEVGASLFSEYDIPLTCFLITDFLDQNIWPWDDQIKYIIDNAETGSYTVELQGKKTEVHIEAGNRRTSQRRSLRNFIKSISNDSLYDDLEQIYLNFRVQQPDAIPAEYLPMTWDNAIALTNSGHFIAAHTLTHRILSRLSDENAEKEIGASILRLQEKTGISSPVFAYPTGRKEDFTSREINYPQKSAILASVSTEPGTVTGGIADSNYLHTLPRYSMPDNIQDFVQYLTWIEVLKDKYRKN